MLINGSVINGEAINGPGTLNPVSLTGSGELFQITQSVTTRASGELLEITQNVSKQGSGELFLITQNVALHQSGSGELFQITQSVTAASSGELFQIVQKVKSASPAFDPVAQFGWDADLFIGGVEMTQYVHGSITVTRAENSASLLDITLIPPKGVQDLESYHGKSVILNVEIASGIYRLYTGIVDIPEVDILGKTITLRCTDRRRELINNQLGPKLPFIGRWSTAIFQTPDTVADELDQRLLTTTNTVDFDANGIAHISDFLPKATPDFTLSGSVIYRRRPSVSITSRGRIINKVNVALETRYVRLRHREKNFTLQGPSFCEVMTTYGLAFMSVDGAASNINSSGWLLKPNSESPSYIPGPGIYDCGAGKFIWNPVSVTGGTVQVKKDENCQAVKDANGNDVTENVGAVYNNYQYSFCTSLTWVAAKNWAQNISEQINITVKAPQSISQFGEVEDSKQYGNDIAYDASSFEQLTDYQAPNGFVDGGDGEYYLDKTGDHARTKQFIGCAVDIAVTEIRKSHRDNTADCQVFLWPQIQLFHTLRMEAPQLTVQGKVSQITHTLDVRTRAAETDIQVGLSRAQGSQADGSLAIPIFNAPLLSDSPNSSYVMKTYNDNAGAGYNYDAQGNPVTSEGVVTPDIEDIARNNQTITSSYSLNIGLQNDDLEVTF